MRTFSQAQRPRLLVLRETNIRIPIVAVLDRLGDNRKETARALGVGETTLWRKLKAYGLVRPREPRS